MEDQYLRRGFRLKSVSTTFQRCQKCLEAGLGRTYHCMFMGNSHCFQRVSAGCFELNNRHVFIIIDTNCQPKKLATSHPKWLVASLI
ncbi:hypothetical protein D6U17_03410 [Lactiplantibacillus pentosus]|uniref:Uncharacterized protein n=1 Tax=Lactiplantibacillus pentosus TaxID=1589 RepID=A0AB37RLQ2_LACPE|nr:hypothetical protein D6U20_10640 [Lactiplantibacillus pentosus]RMW49067.1 hypothetical protein D6U19_02310 [Lactiplantibacillus pentosus]RMW56365.1 hypothetical protein D6U17_03410 [Lactiplantibacillus pentosus]RMW57509.1 hypothetical protein D6U21_01175 [Lactiplantibacillus pentosus]